MTMTMMMMLIVVMRLILILAMMLMMKRIMLVMFRDDPLDARNYYAVHVFVIMCLSVLVFVCVRKSIKTRITGRSACRVSFCLGPEGISLAERNILDNS